MLLSKYVFWILLIWFLIMVVAYPFMMVIGIVLIYLGIATIAVFFVRFISILVYLNLPKQTQWAIDDFMLAPHGGSRWEWEQYSETMRKKWEKRRAENPEYFEQEG